MVLAARLIPRPPVPLLLPLFGGFLLSFGGALTFFLVRAGFRAVVLDAPLLLFNLPEQTRANVASLHPSSWVRGAAQMIYGASLWVGIYFLLELLARLRSPSPGRAASLRRVALLLALLLVCGAIGEVPYGPTFSGGRFSVPAPLWRGRAQVGRTTDPPWRVSELSAC